VRKEKDGFRVDGSEERPTESLRRLVLNNSVVSVCSRTSLDSRAARARGACGCERPAGDRRKQNETPQFEVCGVVSRVLNIASCVCDVEDARLVRYAAIVPRHPSGRRTTPASRPTTRTPTKNPDKDRKGGGLFLFTHLTVDWCPFLFIYFYFVRDRWGVFGGPRRDTGNRLQPCCNLRPPSPSALPSCAARKLQRDCPPLRRATSPGGEKGE